MVQELLILGTFEVDKSYSTATGVYSRHVTVWGVSQCRKAE